MTVSEVELPIYDDRVYAILEALKSGKTREQLADEAGHPNIKTNDMYMRRKNFVWDKDLQSYVPRVNKETQNQETPLSIDESRASQVVARIQRGENVREIAEKLGFTDHRELASYMKTKGYVWNLEKKNYIIENIADDIVSNEGKVEKEQVEVNQSVEVKLTNGEFNQQTLLYDAERFEHFLPLLKKLANHEELLFQLLDSRATSGKIPRFTIRGEAKPKTVQMVHTMQQLIVDFSKEKNISQRELIEVALVEFFRKYGFTREVDDLLG